MDDATLSTLTPALSPSETTADDMFTVEHVTCLAACDKAPMLQCNFHYVESLDMDKMKALLEKWRSEGKAAQS